MFEIPKEPLMAYLSYPFSKNPRLYTKIACKIASRIMLDHPNMFIIVPHSAVDYTLNGLPREKITDYDKHDHTIAAKLEFTTILNVDVFIQGVPDDPKVSMGCIWEHSFAQWLNEVNLREKYRKKAITIIPVNELIRDDELKNIVEESKREFDEGK